jgi:hypothetical protein
VGTKGQKIKYSANNSGAITVLTGEKEGVDTPAVLQLPILGLNDNKIMELKGKKVLDVNRKKKRKQSLSAHQ